MRFKYLPDIQSADQGLLFTNDNDLLRAIGPDDDARHLAIEVWIGVLVYICSFVNGVTLLIDLAG